MVATFLSQFLGCFPGERQGSLGVNLGGIEIGVAEHSLGRFISEPLPHQSATSMAQLMGNPPQSWWIKEYGWLGKLALCQLSYTRFILEGSALTSMRWFPARDILRSHEHRDIRPTCPHLGGQREIRGNLLTCSVVRIQSFTLTTENLIMPLLPFDVSACNLEECQRRCDHWIPSQHEQSCIRERSEESA